MGDTELTPGSEEENWEIKEGPRERLISISV